MMLECAKLNASLPRREVKASICTFMSLLPATQLSCLLLAVVPVPTSLVTQRNSEGEQRVGTISLSRSPRWGVMRSPQGSRPPERKWFTCPMYDEESRTFRGTISWAPTSWSGAAWWEYEMVFSEDLSRSLG
eukprot:603860-Amphidinium_carterae.1